MAAPKNTPLSAAAKTARLAAMTSGHNTVATTAASTPKTVAQLAAAAGVDLITAEHHASSLVDEGIFSCSDENATQATRTYVQQ